MKCNSCEHPSSEGSIVQGVMPEPHPAKFAAERPPTPHEGSSHFAATQSYRFHFAIPTPLLYLFFLFEMHRTVVAMSEIEILGIAASVSLFLGGKLFVKLFKFARKSRMQIRAPAAYLGPSLLLEPCFTNLAMS